jgi:hypothetical protein
MKKFLTKLFGARARTRASSGASFRPRLEGLEGRALPSSLAPVQGVPVAVQFAHAQISQPTVAVQFAHAQVSQPTAQGVQVVTAQVSQQTVLANQSQLQNYSVQVGSGAAANQPVTLAPAPTGTKPTPTFGGGTWLQPAQSQLLVMFPPITSLFASR